MYSLASISVSYFDLPVYNLSSEFINQHFKKMGITSVYLLCVHMSVGKICCSTHLEVKRQLVEIGFSFYQVGPEESNRSLGMVARILMAPSCWSPNLILHAKFWS